MSETIRKPIKLSEINIDSGTQVRVELNQSTVDRYAERMQDGQPFPDVVVFSDGVNYYLADGFHRFFASKKAGRTEIISELHQGTLDDAIWYALGGNKGNGLQMQDTDIQKSIKIALERFPQKSTRQIAEQIGCSKSWVNDVKSKQVSSSGQMLTNGNTQEETDEVPQVIGKDGRSRPARMPKKAKPEPTPTPEPVKKPSYTAPLEEQGPEEPEEIPDTTGDLFEGYSDEVESEEQLEAGVGFSMVEEALTFLTKVPKRDPERKAAFTKLINWLKENM